MEFCIKTDVVNYVGWMMNEMVHRNASRKDYGLVKIGDK